MQHCNLQSTNTATNINGQNCPAFTPTELSLLSLCSIILKFSKNEEDLKLIDVAPNAKKPIIIEMIISIVLFIFFIP